MEVHDVVSAGQNTNIIITETDPGLFLKDNTTATSNLIVVSHRLGQAQAGGPPNCDLKVNQLLQWTKFLCWSRLMRVLLYSMHSLRM